MAINTSDFLDLANSLLSDLNYDNEASHRTIIGRAYYGCFLHFRNRLGLDSWTPGRKQREADIHQIVIDRLKDRDFTASSQLDMIRRERGKADYSINEDISKNTAKYIMFVAQQIIGVL